MTDLAWELRSKVGAMDYNIGFEIKEVLYKKWEPSRIYPGWNKSHSSYMMTGIICKAYRRRNGDD